MKIAIVTDDPVHDILWSPIHRPLSKRVADGDGVILVLSPFATSAAIRQLTTIFVPGTNIKVVCRWRPSDLLSGASDVEVYTVLRDLGCELYINANLHAKLYVYASNHALLTSGNLTLAGLGLSREPNVETGAFLKLSTSDWEHIFEVLQTSRHVDEAMYIRFKDFVERHPKPPATPEEANTLAGLVGEKKRFTIASLPATLTPAKLSEYYFGKAVDQTPEDHRRATHDLFTFKIQPGLAEGEFFTALNEAFRASPFVTAFVEFLRAEQSLRFGSVKDWMHKLCEDVPLPYKWELNENVRILYDWLAHFYSEISWRRPNFSQVIYWKVP